MKKSRRLVTMLLALALTTNTVGAHAATISQAVADKVNEIVSTLITEKTSTYKRAKVLHDWLIYNANYDLTYTNYDPEGVLLEGSGVCQSYAMAYELLLEAAGVQQRLVVSDEINHAWNMVKIDGEWYHVDTTWDDPVSADYSSAGGYERDTYFLMSDDDIDDDHIDWYGYDYFHGNYANVDTPIADSDDFDTLDPDDTGNAKHLGTFENLKAELNWLVSVGETGGRLYKCSYDGSQAMYNDILNWAWYSSHSGFRISTIWRSSDWIQMEVYWDGVDDYVFFEKSKDFVDIGDTLQVTVAESTSDSYVWQSSNTAVATVNAQGIVTGIAAGTAKITATVNGSTAKDTLELTVLPPMQADFNLTFARSGSSAYLTWKEIPGVTEYRVYCRESGTDSYLYVGTVAKTNYTITGLSSSKTYSFYVKAQRVADGKVIAAHSSPEVGDYVPASLAILQQPQSVVVGNGKEAVVTLKAEGEGLTYEWYYKDALSGQYLLAPFTGATYNITMRPEYSGRQVYCVVTDKSGKSIQSNIVTLTMGNFATIIQQPESVTVTSGEMAEVTVLAEGDGLTYAWYYSPAGSDKFTYTASFTGNTYSVAMRSDRAGRQIYCVITDQYGNSVQSNTVTLGMKTELAITFQPSNVIGESGKLVQFFLTAQGDGLTYQWYYMLPGSDVSVPASTSEVYSFAPKQEHHGVRVYCVVTDQYGNSVTSNFATLFMEATLEITQQPKSVTVARGQTAKVTVQASGDNLSYNWYYKNAGSSKFTYTGTFKGNTYSVQMNADRAGRQVYCIITDAAGNSVQSDIVTLGMEAGVSITTQPKSVTVARGETAKVTVQASGEGLTYKWYYKNAGSSKFTYTSTFKGSSYSVQMNAERAGRQVYCVVTDKYGNKVTSETVTLGMEAGVTITTQPKSVTVARGATAKVTVKASGEGLTYKWYYKNAGSSKFTYTSSFKGSTYSVSMNAERAGRQVYCVVTDKYGNKVTTNTVTLGMSTGLTITSQPQSVLVAKGETAKVTVKASGEGLTYKWYYKNAGSSKFVYTSSFKGSTYSVSMNAERDGRQVYCVITDANGNTVKTETVVLSMK